MKKQTIYVHLRTHNIDPNSGSTISKKILYSNIIYRYERESSKPLRFENIPTIMNGYAGRILDI